MNVCGKEIKVTGRFLKTGTVSAEGYNFLDDPEATILELRKSSDVDLFTFIPRLAERDKVYNYPTEPDNAAALTITTFDNWWTKQINGKTRNKARVAEKRGLTVREVPFDDALARGIHEIYNEAPIRQGRIFPHYGKDFETVKTMSATFLDRSVFIGAYLEEQLVGFLKFTFDEVRSQASVMHILSMMKHRDKSPTNALIAEGVKACADRNVPYLIYSNFSYGKKQKDSLAEFKENNGFERLEFPRYYVALTSTGRLALRLGLHHSLSERMPESIASTLRHYRTMWYMRKYGEMATS
jgi:hypothetical protein